MGMIARGPYVTKKQYNNYYPVVSYNLRILMLEGQGCEIVL